MDERPRILGVDDSLTIRKALELVLKPAGYTLELAASGAEAVEKARGFQPAAILLDFILPDMRGTEVCRRLAADPETAGIPVVLISAKGAEIRQAYQDVGNVVGYIAKPFTPEAIIEVLRDVVARARNGSLAALKSGVGEIADVAAVAQTNGHEAAVPDAMVPTDEVAVAAPNGSAEPVPAIAAPLAASWDQPPANGAAPHSGGASDAWDEGDEAGLDEETPAPTIAGDQPRRELVELMFEALSAGLEGVYVEEIDTPAGAAADEAKSYTDLVAQLTRQLGEALTQARAGRRFALCSDGSIRSLDDVLFDAYRRVCRLLFRAAAGGAVAHTPSHRAARVLVACHRDSDLFASVREATDGRGAWHTLLVSERFRQLPILTRLYGPTHLVVEIAGSGALWDQLGALRAMPELRRMRVVGVARAAADSARAVQLPDAAALRARGVEEVLHGDTDLAAAMRRWIVGAADDVATAWPPDETETAITAMAS